MMLCDTQREPLIVLSVPDAPHASDHPARQVPRATGSPAYIGTKRMHRAYALDVVFLTYSLP